MGLKFNPITSELDLVNPEYDPSTDAIHVVGPASSTDNAIARYDGATGKLIQDSSTSTINDGGQLILRPAPTTGGVLAGLDVINNPQALTARTQGASIFGTVSDGFEPSGYVAGIEGRAISNSTGTVPLAYGLNYSVENRNSGTMTQAYGISLSVGNYSTGSGVITHAYGAYVAMSGLGAGSASITNAYGVYIQNMTGVTGLAYGIYQAGTAQSNYLAGSVGFGVLSPTARLQLAADTTASGGILFGTDTNLYRSAADTLRTDDNLFVAQNAAMGGTAINADTTLIASQNATDPAAAKTGANFSRVLSITSPNAQVITGGIFNVSTMAQAFNHTGILRGGFFQVQNANTATVSDMKGGQFLAYNVSTGTVTSAASGQFDIQNLNASGVITNAYGVNVSMPFNNGTIANTYGLYVGDITKGTQTNQAYGLYVSDANARNFMAGVLHLGSTDTSISRSSPGTVKVSGLAVEELNGVLTASGGKISASGQPSTDGASKTSVGFTQPTNPTPNDLWVDTGSGTSTGRGKPTLSAMFMGRRGGSNFFSKQLGAPLQARRTIAQNWFFGESGTAAMKLWNGTSWITVT